jgi:hypothetical protein
MIAKPPITYIPGNQSRKRKTLRMIAERASHGVPSR